MPFSLPKSLEILSRTPSTLRAYLEGLSDEWIYNNEGGDTWSPYTVVGHLIHGEKTDWMVRIKIILGDQKDKRFTPFDRLAQFETDQDRPLSTLLDEFEGLRKKNLEELKALNIQKGNLTRTGIHPEFGEVTLQQLLATWVVHDLGHLSQISRVMAKQYKEDAGPWVEYLGILKD